MQIDSLKNFSEQTNGKLIFDYDLRKTNWFNIGGKAKAFFKPENLNDLVVFLRNFGNREKIFILGVGSNILIKDQWFDGVIVKLGKNFSNISVLKNNTIIAGSATIDKKVAEFASENNIGGLEFLSCIPGSIGGGIRMNSGCFGTEFKDILLSVQAIDSTGKVLTIPSSNIKFEYRTNDIPRDLIFLSASFKGKFKNLYIPFAPTDSGNSIGSTFYIAHCIFNRPRKKIDNKSFIGKFKKKYIVKKDIEVLKTKKEEAQPTKVKTGGSTFKNPIRQTNKKVWELIKFSIPKNISFGDATVSDKHCNFFVNKNKATYEDMKKLIDFVKESVKEKTGVNLDLEIEIVE